MKPIVRKIVESLLKETPCMLANSRTCEACAERESCVEMTTTGGIAQYPKGMSFDHIPDREEELRTGIGVTGTPTENDDEQED